jgi:uncharacterized protein YceH (UPF0502 family)
MAQNDKAQDQDKQAAADAKAQEAADKQAAADAKAQADAQAKIDELEAQLAEAREQLAGSVGGTVTVNAAGEVVRD